MQIIKGSRHFKQLGAPDPVITLGNFDGVHLGHQKILQEVIARARTAGAPSVVYTFVPHPLQLLKPDIAPLKLTAADEQARRIEQAGIDYLVYEKFTRALAQRTPESFVRAVVHGRLHPREIVIGHDYAFGKSRRGSVALLRQLGRAYGFTVHEISDIRIKNIPVRSTTIRSLIVAGKVSLAAKLMGRAYSLTGRVVHGRRRRIGFPTANLTPSTRDLTPGNGVYAIIARTPYGACKGVVNIGTNPTFDCDRRTIEAHLFDFDRDLYGQTITLFFIRKIRDEKKFNDVKPLTDRIARDIAFAHSILDTLNNPRVDDL
jgi:riboflavin kinase / FMN adenylyltransferase